MILVLRALGVGDLVTAVPALRALRAAYPDRELALAAPGGLAPLVDLVGGVDRLVDTAGLDGPSWPGPAPQVAVNLHGRGPRSHRLLAAARPGRLLAFANADAGFGDGPRWVDDEHEVDRWCRLLSWYDIPTDRRDLDCASPQGSVDRPAPPCCIRAARSPPSGGPPSGSQPWPGRSTNGGTTCWSPARPTNVRWPPGWPRRPAAPAAVLAGRTDLGALAALVADARLVVSGDTGVAHLATAYGTASVVLFGPVPPAAWGPPPDRPRHRALWVGEGDWRRWDGVGSHPTLTALRLDEVLAAVDEVERAVRVSGAVAA